MCDTGFSPGRVVRQLLDRTQEWAGRKRAYFPMPYWLAKLQAILTWPLPNALRPLTYDQVRLLAIDNVVSAAAISQGRSLEGLGVARPQAMGAIVPFASRGSWLGGGSLYLLMRPLIAVGAAIMVVGLYGWAFEPATEE